MKKYFLAIAMAAIMHMPAVQAQIVEYTETGTYIMSAEESKADGIIKAKQQAMRQAAEKAGVYIEGKTEVVNNQLTKDEITSIYGTIVSIKHNGREEFAVTENKEFCVKVTLTVEVDTAKVDTAINKILELRQADKQKANYKRRAQQAEDDNFKLKEQNRRLEEAVNKNNAIEKKYNKADERENRYKNNVNKQHEANNALREKEFQQKRLEKQRTENSKKLSAPIVARGTAEEWYNKAVQALNKYEYTKANEYINKSISIDPEVAKYYFLRAQATYEDSAAIKDYTTVLHLKKDSPITYYKRGVLYYKHDKNKEALADFEMYLKSNPPLDKKIDAICMRGASYRELKQHFNALHEYEQVIKLAPQDSRGYYGRGEVYRRQKLWTEAIENYNKAMALTKNSNEFIVYLYRRLKCYKHNKQYEEALKDAALGLKLYPKSYDFYVTQQNLYIDTYQNNKVDSQYVYRQELEKRSGYDLPKLLQ